MSRFNALLQQTARQLDIPQPTRSRVLLEMAADLEDLFEHYRRRGLDDAQAARLVQDKFELSDAVLAQLVWLHRAPLRRWLDRFSEQAQTLWERVVLTVVVIVVGASSGRLLLGSPLLRDASAFVWPVLTIALLVAAVTLVKVYGLFVKQDHRLGRLRRGLPLLLLLACGSFLTGLIGLLVGLYAALARFGASGDPRSAQLPATALGASATLVIALLVALVATLIWFLLMHKVKRVEDAELQLLTEERR